MARQVALVIVVIVSVRRANNQRHGAVVRSAFCTKTPGDAGVPAREIQGLFPLCAVAVTAGTSRFATTIHVGDQIVLVIDRIVAGANPVH